MFHVYIGARVDTPTERVCLSGLRVNSAMVHGADPSDKGGLVVSARHGLIVMLLVAFLYFGGGEE